MSNSTAPWYESPPLAQPEMEARQGAGRGSEHQLREEETRPLLGDCERTMTQHKLV